MFEVNSLAILKFRIVVDSRHWLQVTHICFQAWGQDTLSLHLATGMRASHHSLKEGRWCL